MPSSRWQARERARRSSKAEVVILLVRPDPKPGNHIAFAQSERAVMVADAHHRNAVASFFEVK